MRKVRAYESFKKIKKNREVKRGIEAENGYMFGAVGHGGWWFKDYVRSFAICCRLTRARAGRTRKLINS